jgi:hypothetical protein
MNCPLLRICWPDQASRLEVRRDQDVPDDFWLQTRSEWGSEGPEPGVAIEVPADCFLARIDWLAPACRQHRVGVKFCPRSQQALATVMRERARLGDVLRRVEPLPQEQLLGLLAGTRFTRPLKDFQLRDLAYLARLDHGADFSVPGAGKTVKACARYELLRQEGKVQRMLVVAPLSAHEAWQEEGWVSLEPGLSIGAFDGRVPTGVEVVLINYHRLPYPGVLEQLIAWLSERPTLLVLDEGHRAKAGRQRPWGRICLELACHAAHRLVLTGTPAPQALTDLEFLVEFLWPTQGRRILPASVLARSGGSACREASQRLRPLFARTTKGELGLTPPGFHVIRVPMTPLQREIHEALRGRLSPQFSRSDRRVLGDLGQNVMHLLQAATNPALLSDEPDPDAVTRYRPPLVDPLLRTRLAELLRDYDRKETPAKFTRLATLVEEKVRQERKVLVWSNFPANLERLRRLLSRFQPAVVHGKVVSELAQPTADITREKELQRFRTDSRCMVLLTNPATLGEGVSLHQVCHEAVYVDRSFNAGQYLQSVDRIHRLGLAADVETNVTFLVSAGSIEERVYQLIEAKAQRLGQLMDDPHLVTMSLPSDDDVCPDEGLPSHEDLAALFDYLRGEGRHPRGNCANLAFAPASIH